MPIPMQGATQAKMRLRSVKEWRAKVGNSCSAWGSSGPATATHTGTWRDESAIEHVVHSDNELSSLAGVAGRLRGLVGKVKVVSSNEKKVRT
jgi:hypothetical protein